MHPNKPTTMKLPHNPADDINNALHILDKSLPQTDQDIEQFLAALDTGAIETPELPQHLKPAAIVAAIRAGRVPAPAGGTILQFPAVKPQPGLSGLKMAARNGDGPLSDETLRKIEEAQED